MTFLPIVERELRVAARKRSTFWLRVVAALVALVIGGGFLILSTFTGSVFGAASLGKGLFATLTWLSLAVALSAGLFFTSDCLSEEKRDGTLGFLFLTDLRGYDVVLGKLLATSLRGFYALLAVFPILAITLLMGGVTGGQFWMTLLALVNALFVSLAAGMFVSAISRYSQRALAATLFLLFVIVTVGPAIDGTFAAIKGRAFNPVLSLTSSGYLFVSAGGSGQSPFWLGLVANQAVAWTLFGLSSVLLPRTWQERARKISAVKANWSYAWKFGGAKSRRVFRRKLIEPNPVLWLACRERWQSWALWMLTILIAGGFVATFASKHRELLAMIWSSCAGLLTLVLYLGTASQAGRFFVEARRSGLIELLLATPLTSKQIVQGQGRALLRMFGAPLVVLVAVQLLGTFLAQQMTWSRIAAVTPPTPTVATTTNTTTNTTLVTRTTVTTSRLGTTTAVSVGGFAGPNEIVMLVISVAGTLTFLANLAALCWFGMWMGMNSRNNNLATLKTIVFVQVIPWFVLSFASMMIVPLLLLPGLMKGVPSATSQMMTWYPLLASGVATVLYLAKDVGFSLWARRKLYSEFREQAVRSVSPILPALPPPLPDVNVPPVIAPG
ncbi:MAG: ABC transporter permease subunit [Verrucomicrobia bacterium]|nr:ABC transporter permease subunit [Verrucomicrobiota bacterium]